MNIQASFNPPAADTGDSILEFIIGFREDHGENCTYNDLEDEFGDDVWPHVHALIAAGKAFVAVPLSMLDYDSAILPVTWASGLSTASDIEAELGEPHAATATPQGLVLTYDLYLEFVEGDYPQPPAPYHLREAADEDRPEDCAFFYTNVWPPEALQIEFAFNPDGVLVRHEFKVGTRCPSATRP